MAVEEKKNGKMMPGVCTCGCSNGSRHWTFFLLRTLITVIILMFVFWCGVAAGKLSSGIGRYGMMQAYTTGVYNGGTAMPMLRINGATSTATSGATGVQNY